MLKQYQQIKAQHRNCILFFRLGDFYEMFYDDAKKASSILDLVLTCRGAGKSGKIPMCGIPYHAADNYISRLIKAGLKVAICEQVQDPAVAKGIVKRDVIRVITSGTFIDENSHNCRYILCLTPNKKGMGIAFSDSSSGVIHANQYQDINKTFDLISRLSIYECIYPQMEETTIREIFNHPLLKEKNITLSPYEDWCFNAELMKKSLCEHFSTHSLKGFAIDAKPYAVSSAGALLEYLKQMTRQPMRHIDKISLYQDDDYVFISGAACLGLNLEELIKTIDFTITPLGKRKLSFWVYHPLKSQTQISGRQQAVTLLKDNPQIQEELKKVLGNLPDIEKNISRLSCGYTHAKDFLALRNAIIRIPQIQKAIAPLASNNPAFSIEDIPSLRKLLEEAINPALPLSHPEGKTIRPGFNSELDSLRQIQENHRQWLRDLQAQEIKRTKINSLKIGYNKVFGYYIEISKANLPHVPSDYIRKQTLVNAERFITPQLKEFEEKMLTAEERVLKIEDELLKNIHKEILDNCSALHLFCFSIATLDVILSLSVLAQKKGYVRPRITEQFQIIIKGGRHPTVEMASGDPFIPNDTLLDCENNHLLLITGPNMAGKSTYIRQVAILVILAQMGSFIPADSAQIGVVDKIFTRIGAHDQISKGQSTFMVEMNETAQILNNLSSRSLIILDEIGRGTSTYDGLSLAWAISEYLQQQKVRTLFATHFHELTALAEEFCGVKNYNVAVKEWKDQIVFLHKIIPGGTDDSYGIYVAKLAGIPREVIDRAKKILTNLEIHDARQQNLRSQPKQQAQLSLFSQNRDQTAEEIKNQIESLDITSMTPLQALNKIQQWKEIIDRD
ncbi:MAG: DNA mismatch repair protein MutS [Candidatus Omnitrophota bacterium]|nr:MAG: DNA mismatch repair protein MutS [Candidatus Omnitrophota bacterium]